MKDRQHAQKIVDIVDIQKAYEVGGGQVPVLKGLSLAVEPGEFLAITGPSGNGKSTLLNMITGIDRPTSGAGQWFPGEHNERKPACHLAR